MAILCMSLDPQLHGLLQPQHDRVPWRCDCSTCFSSRLLDGLMLPGRSSRAKDIEIPVLRQFVETLPKRSGGATTRSSCRGRPVSGPYLADSP